MSIDKKTGHKHIWKYDGNYVRTCEAPFPTIKGCGKMEKMTMFNGWVDYNQHPEGAGFTGE